MVSLMSMPRIDGGNALADFSPINNAIDGAHRNALARREDQRAQETHDVAMQRARSAGGRSGSDNVARLGQIAGGIANLPDDSPLKAQAWNKWLDEHGRDPGMSPEELDHRTGPALAAIAAGKYAVPDPRVRQKDDLDMDYKRAQIDSLRRKEEPDPVTQMLLKRMQGDTGQAPQTPQAMPVPQAQPQSLPMDQRGPRLQPMRNGNALSGGTLQNAADVTPQAPQPAPVQQAPTADVIETPYGKMSREEATKLGGMMLLSPKHAAAGKALLDATQGGGPQGALGTTARNTVDEKAIGQVDLAARLDSIAAKFKPEFLTYETGVKMGVTGMLDSFEATRGNISQQDAKQLQEYTSFKQDAMNNLSEYIKYITGAAMGVQEEGRIRKGMPDPAKDSPREFAAKLNSSIQSSKLVLARMNYLKRNGYDENTIGILAKQDALSRIKPLDDMQGIINQRLDQAAKELKQANPGIDDMSLKQAIRQIQKQEFGI